MGDAFDRRPGPPLFVRLGRSRLLVHWYIVVLRLGDRLRRRQQRRWLDADLAPGVSAGWILAEQRDLGQILGGTLLSDRSRHHWLGDLGCDQPVDATAPGRSEGP